MRNGILSDLKSYIRDIAWGWIPAFLLLLDILDAISDFSPSLAAEFVDDLALFRLVLGLLAFVSFLIANFLMYRRLVKKSALQFEVERVKGMHMPGQGFINLIGNEAVVQPVFDIEPTVGVFLVNTGSPTAVQVSVVSVEPDCLPDDTSLDQIEIFIRDESGRSTIDNPMWLNTDDMRRVRISARIPFATTKVEDTAGAVSSLRSIRFTLGAQAPSQKLLQQVIPCDLSPLHSKMQEDLAKKVQHLQSTRVSGQDFMEAVKRYYRGPTDTS